MNTYDIYKNPIGLYEIRKWDDNSQQWVKACPWLLASKQEAEQVIASVIKAEVSNA